MKSIKLIPLAAAFVLFSCNKDDGDTDTPGTEPIPNDEVKAVFSVEPSSNKEAFVGIISRTNCGACGQHGHPNFDDVVHDQEDANPVAFHYSTSDDMYHEDAAKFVNFVGIRFTPTFTSGTANLGNVKGDLEGAVMLDLTSTPEAKIAMNGELKGEKAFDITIELSEITSTESMQLALYVIENNYITGQSDYGANPTWVDDYVHNYVFRSAPSGIWGKAITMADPMANYSFDLAHGINPDNVQFVAVLYAVDGSGEPTGVINSQRLTR